MLTCNEDCDPVCEFCIHCEDLDEYDDDDIDGFCVKHNRHVNWAEKCDDFHCVLVGTDADTC